MSDQPTITTVATTPPTLTIDWYIEKYVALRDKLATVEAAHKEKTRPVREMMKNIEGAIINYLQESKQQSAKTEHGTAFFKTDTSVTVSDWEQTLRYIRHHEVWELLEARVSKTAAVSMIEETKEPIPGVTVRQELSVNIRRPTGKTPE